MSLMIELLARGLAGVDPELPDTSGLNGTFMLALDIPAIAPIAQFEGAAARLSQQIASAAPLAGFERVLLPGQPEALTRQARLAAGIPVPASSWAEIAALASELGLEIEQAFKLNGSIATVAGTAAESLSFRISPNGNYVVFRGGADPDIFAPRQLYAITLRENGSSLFLPFIRR